MSFIGSMLGAGQGSSWNATNAGPGVQQGSLLNPTTTAQANTAYDQTQQGLAQQQAFVNATQGGGAQGLAAQNQLTQQLQQQSLGGGPNPAQAQLAQNTAANVAQQSALMAGQRGAGQNVGLMARQAGQQGAATQQAAAGQAASLQAQQQLAAQSGLANMANTQVGQQSGAITNYNQMAQGSQQNILGGIAAQNNAQVGLYASQNAANNAIQVQNSKAQQGIFGGLLGGAGSMLAHGGEVKKPQKYGEGGHIDSLEINKPSKSGKMDQTQMPVQQVQQAQQGVNPNQAAMQQMMQPRMYADGTTSVQPSMVAPSISAPTVGSQPTGPSSSIGKFLRGGFSQDLPPAQQQQSSSGGGDNPVGAGAGKLVGKVVQEVKNFLPQTNSNGMNTKGIDPKTGAPQNAGQLGPEEAPEVDEGAEAAEGSDAAEGAGEAAAADEGAESAGSEIISALAKGGKIKGKKVPALVSPGERYLPPSEVKKVAQGKKSPIKAGEKIPGKAKVKGDSYMNDTVPKTLEEGGIVLPKSVMESKHPHWAAHKFVSGILAKQALKRK